MNLYIHSPTHFHGIVLNQLSIGNLQFKQKKKNIHKIVNEFKQTRHSMDKKQPEQNAGCLLKTKERKLVLCLHTLLENPSHPLHMGSRPYIFIYNV
jgi:hypothetical protein